MRKTILTLALSASVTLYACGALGTPPLSLDVYKLRLTEVIQKTGEDIQNKELQQDLSDSVNFNADTRQAHVKDIKQAKSGYQKLAQAFEKALNEFNGLTPPVGLESKHDQIKKFFQETKDLLNEINGFPDEENEFSKKLVVQSVKISQLEEDATEVLRSLSLNSGSSGSFFSFPRSTQQVSQAVISRPAPAPSASAVPIPRPTAAPTAAPIPRPTTAPIPRPTTAPSATPFTVPTAFPTIAPTATPSPTPESIIKTTFTGKVYDNNGTPFDGATVTVKSLSTTVSYEATTTTSSGSYSFSNAPSGVSVEIITTKAGFATRRRVEVLKSNKQGDPNANKYDFGNIDGSTTASMFAGSISNALSDKPEVVTATPGRNRTNISPQTSFVLKFSEPMNKTSVEQNFAIRQYMGSITDFSGELIFDSQSFNISWSSDNSEMTLSFKTGLFLPANKGPDFQVSFTAQGSPGAIQDSTGISRNSQHFKLTDGNFEASYRFSI